MLTAITNYACQLALLIVVALLGGCGSNLPQRLEHADNLTTKVGMRAERIQTDQFLLTTYHKLIPGSVVQKNQTLYVYLEGDGFAFVDRHTPSLNPTPNSPVALELSTIHQAHNPKAAIVYIARPCQYTPLELDHRCNTLYWSERRLAPEVVAATSQALDIILRQYNLCPKSTRIVLIGFSGGGALALLVAAKRGEHQGESHGEVKRVVTVGANIDVDEFIRHHGLSPMEGSLNPVAFAKVLRHIPQLHLVGTRDKIIPINVANSYQQKLGHPHTIKIQTLSASHNAGWNQFWPQIAAFE